MKKGHRALPTEKRWPTVCQQINGDEIKKFLEDFMKRFHEGKSGLDQETIEATDIRDELHEFLRAKFLTAPTEELAEALAESVGAAIMAKIREHLQAINNDEPEADSFSHL